MTEFEVHLPYRDEDEWIVDVIDAARETQTGDELRVTERIAYDALARGVTKISQLLDEIESADPAERRQLVDKAREEVGLRSLSEIEERQRVAAIVRDDPPPPPRSEPQRDQGGKAIQECAEPSCEVISPGDGTIAPVAAKKWWCQTHEANAADGDLDDWVDPGVRIGPTGAPMMTLEAEAHYRRLGEETKAKREAKDRLDRHRRAEEAERIERLERDHFAAMGSSLPPGWGPS